MNVVREQYFYMTVSGRRPYNLARTNQKEAGFFFCCLPINLFCGKNYQAESLY